MMSGNGLTHATKTAILNANYVAHRLDPYFPVLYKGKQGLVAHEAIIDLRHCKNEAGITVEDIAKRLISISPLGHVFRPGSTLVWNTIHEVINQSFCAL